MKNMFYFLYYSIKKIFCRHHFEEVGVLTVGMGSEHCIVGKVYCCDKCKKRKHTEVKYLWKNGCELIGNISRVKPGYNGKIKLQYHDEMDEVSIVRIGDKYIELEFADGSVGQFSFCCIDELILW